MIFYAQAMAHSNSLRIRVGHAQVNNFSTVQEYYYFLKLNKIMIGRTR